MCLVLTSAEASRCENISSLSLFFLLSSFSSFSPLRVFTSRLSNRLRHERKKGKKGERNVVERGEIENSIGFDRIPAVERVRLFSPMNPYLREQRTDQAILVNSTFTYALSNRVEIVAKLVNTPLTRIEQPRNARNCRVAIDGARSIERRNFRRVIGIDCDNFQLFQINSLDLWKR